MFRAQFVAFRPSTFRPSDLRLFRLPLSALGEGSSANSFPGNGVGSGGTLEVRAALRVYTIAVKPLVYRLQAAGRP